MNATATARHSSLPTAARPAPVSPRNDPQQPASHPLRLGSRMRQRLSAAVRHILDNPALTGLPDTARLLVVVAAAKAHWNHGCITHTRITDLARWLGVGPSTIDKTLASLRRAGALATQERLNPDGSVNGLDCAVPDLVGTRCAGHDPRHPLALSQTELATFLRLIEALFGPGWQRPDGSGTAPGLLADRTGRGAATDRLALLLLALETRSNGRVRLCGGAVRAGRGRPATTVARMVGCTPAGGEKVLRRLQEAGVVRVRRKETCSGLHGRSELLVPAVAVAHGQAVQLRVVAEPAAVVSGHQPAVGTTSAQFTGQGLAVVPGAADTAVDPSLHTDHAQVVDQVVKSDGESGVSGEAETGLATRAGSACARTRTTRLRRPVPQRGRPDLVLRTDEPIPSPASSVSGADTGSGSGPAGRRANGNDRVVPALTFSPTIHFVLEPVRWLMPQVNTYMQRRIAQEVGRQVREGCEPKRLQQRLQTRLGFTGPEQIRDVGRWLLGAALERWGCPNPDCESGVLWSSGAVCAICPELAAERRAAQQGNTGCSSCRSSGHGCVCRRGAGRPDVVRPQWWECLGCERPSKAPRPEHGMCRACALRTEVEDAGSAWSVGHGERQATVPRTEGSLSGVGRLGEGVASVPDGAGNSGRTLLRELPNQVASDVLQSTAEKEQVLRVRQRVAEIRQMITRTEEP